MCVYVCMCVCASMCVCECVYKADQIYMCTYIKLHELIYWMYLFLDCFMSTGACILKYIRYVALVQDGRKY